MIHAAEADHVEKVLDLIFVARDQSPEPPQRVLVHERENYLNLGFHLDRVPVK